MMIPYEHAFAFFGFAVSSFLASLAFVLVLFVGSILVLRYTPRLHFGVPRADIELRSFARAAIRTGKDGKPLQGELWQEFQRLKVARWYGLSPRNSVRWFFGFILFAEKEVL